jgi:4-alpha-glucanotransferase
MKVRASGILLHLSSLPSAHGIGDMGPGARRFASFLAEMRQCYWQMLPLCPTSSGMCHSPYAGYSAFAGNPLFISPGQLVLDHLLKPDEALDEDFGDESDSDADPRRVDFTAVETGKRALLDLVFQRHGKDFETDPDFRHFCRKQEHWLEDFALFTTLKGHFNGADWSTWPEPLRFRDPDALDQWRDQGREQLAKVRLVQYLFHLQWSGLKRFCNENGVNLIGDLPIYVTRDSADVWSRPELYLLDDDLRPTHVAGVPPDYFSATGQRWGNPVYDWDAHKDEDYVWWARRFGHELSRFDFMRVDHFRGFVAHWRIPAEEPTAVNGVWEPSPGEELFTSLLRRCGALPLIAEDLGVITADVRELKQRFGLPGMKILQFAFGDEWDKHVPHLHERNCVVYSGTHDNNTVRGWFAHEATRPERQALARYLGCPPGEEDVHVALIRLGLQSVANTAVFPMQDVLGLGTEHRMNTPGTTQGNWLWRLLPTELDIDRLAWFREMTTFFDRA